MASTQYKLDAGAWTTGTAVTIAGDGVHTLAYRSTDALGTVEAEKSATVRIDAAAPVTSDDAPTGWSKTGVVKLTATDNGGSGVAATEYKLDGGAWTSGAQVTVTGDGVHTLAYRSTDALGTVEADKTATVRIDTKPPLTSDDAPTTWSKTAVTVHLTASDAGSGVASTQYRLDGGGWTSGTQVTVSARRRAHARLPLHRRARHRGGREERHGAHRHEAPADQLRRAHHLVQDRRHRAPHGHATPAPAWPAPSTSSTPAPGPRAPR